MDKMNLITLLAISLPEAVAVVLLGFTLVGINVQIPKILLIGLIQTGFSYILRSLPIAFGFHSLIQVVFLFLLVKLITRLPYKSVLTSLLLSLAIYIVLEMSILSFLHIIYPLSLKDNLADPIKRILFFLPQFIIVILIITAMKITGYKLIDLPESWGKYEQEK